MDLSITLGALDLALREHTQSLLPLNFPGFWFKILECSFIKVKL